MTTYRPSEEQQVDLGKADMGKKIAFELGREPETPDPLSLLVGNVEWLRQVSLFGGLFESSAKIAARVDGKLVGLEFAVDFRHQMYGHRTVEKSGEFVRVEEIRRDRLLDYVYNTDKGLLTAEELAEREEIHQQRERDQARIEAKWENQQRENEKREYERLRRKFNKGEL